ncbi:hypothetical protein AHAS_Ahas11G0085200 [Arachis hypogaea]
MFHIHHQTQVQHPRIELYVEFEHIDADEIQRDPPVQNDRAEAYEGMNNDSEEEFEATYEASDEDEDDDGEHAPEFPEYANIGVVDLEDVEFSIKMEYNSRKSIIVAIQNYTISRGVNYIVYESEPQTFYAKCKTYGHTVAEAMKPLVESDPCIKAKYIVAEVQARFNYTISYRNTWLAKSKSIAKAFGGWEESYQAWPCGSRKWFRRCLIHKFK